MSTATLRYHLFTVSFLPARRDRLISAAVRTMKTRVSRRRFRKAARYLVAKLNAA
jgi:hypothetical protein